MNSIVENGLVEPKADGLWFDRVGRGDGDSERDASARAIGWGHALFVDVALDGHHAFDEHFWTRRASGHIDIDRDELVNALDCCVGIEDAACGGAGAHGDDPLGFGHLFVDSLENGEHLDTHAACDDEQVCLPWGESHDFGAESGKVVARGCSGHEFDPAAGGGEGHRPET